MSEWRQRAAPIIAQVLAENQGKKPMEIRAALREAYPFGPKAYWPYKVWLDEIQRQTGKKKRSMAHLLRGLPRGDGDCPLFDLVEEPTTPKRKPCRRSATKKCTSSPKPGK